MFFLAGWVTFMHSSQLACFHAAVSGSVRFLRRRTCEQAVSPAHSPGLSPLVSSVALGFRLLPFLEATSPLNTSASLFPPPPPHPPTAVTKRLNYRDPLPAGAILLFQRTGADPDREAQEEVQRDRRGGRHRSHRCRRRRLCVPVLDPRQAGGRRGVRIGRHARAIAVWRRGGLRGHQAVAFRRRRRGWRVRSGA